MALAEGGVIAGRYVLDRMIGKGGQGTLWSATDRSTKQHVAVKIFTMHHQAAHWSRREITVLRGLPPSRYVVSVLDFGNEQGEPYLVMDWIDGRSLHELSRPRLERLQHWSRQICLGLQHCHDNGVYHRDLKPSNVMITNASDAVLVDFGIARTDESTVTMPGYPVGSAPYMAPERWAGSRGDHRTDLYSFGCLLYELLTGDPPFGRMRESADVELLRYKHLNDRPVRPTAGFSGIPESLDRLTMALLAKKPGDRPRSAGEVIDRLQEIVHPALGPTAVDETARTPHIDPDSVGRLHDAEAAFQDALAHYGPDHLQTLEARAEIAKLTGMSGDRTGAVRAYDELIHDYVRIFGPYDRRTQEVREARMIWVLGRIP